MKNELSDNLNPYSCDLEPYIFENFGIEPYFLKDLKDKESYTEEKIKALDSARSIQRNLIDYFKLKILEEIHLANLKIDRSEFSAIFVNILATFVEFNLVSLSKSFNINEKNIRNGFNHAFSQASNVRFDQEKAENHDETD